MKVKVAVVFTVLFFGIMIFLTFSARDIHNKTIPNVKVSRLTKAEFEYEYRSNTGTKVIETKLCPAIPKELYNHGEIYVIDYIEINGEIRTVARRIILEIGRQNNQYYEVINDYLDSRIRFITYSNKIIQEGGEVYIIQ